jgi:hypothetical protein
VAERQNTNPNERDSVEAVDRAGVATCGGASVHGAQDSKRNPEKGAETRF